MKALRIFVLLLTITSISFSIVRNPYDRVNFKGLSQAFLSFQTILFLPTYNNIITTSSIEHISPTSFHHTNNFIANARNLPESNGASGKFIGTAKVLTPIIKLRDNIHTASTLIETDPKQALNIINKLPNKEVEFKRLFDEFSNGVSYKQQYLDKNAFVVYYTQGFDGPGRPSIESDSDGESTKMSMQYGYRNDAWLALKDAVDDITDLNLTTTYAAVPGEPSSLETYDKEYKQSIKDIMKELSIAEKAINAYISLAPEAVIKEAEL